MRPMFAFFLVVFIIGGVFAYSIFVDRIRPEPPTIKEDAAEGRYDLEVRCTFDCKGDEFGQAAVKIKFRDLMLLEENSFVKAGQSIRINGIEQIKVGSNDIFVAVTPVGPTAASNDPFSLSDLDNSSTSEPNNPASEHPSVGVARAVHIRIYLNNHVVAEKTLWSELAGPISDLVQLDVRK